MSHATCQKVTKSTKVKKNIIRMKINFNLFCISILTTWSKVWVNRLYVITVCAFIHLELGTLLYNWAWPFL